MFGPSDSDLTVLLLALLMGAVAFVGVIAVPYLWRENGCLNRRRRRRGRHSA